MKEYTGVHWNTKEQCWKAFITLSRKRHLCGIFVNQIDAVKSRDKAILKFGLPTKLQILKPVKL